MNLEPDSKNRTGFVVENENGCGEPGMGWPMGICSANAERSLAVTESFEIRVSTLLASPVLPRPVANADLFTDYDTQNIRQESGRRKRIVIIKENNDRSSTSNIDDTRLKLKGSQRQYGAYSGREIERNRETERFTRINR